MHGFGAWTAGRQSPQGFNGVAAGQDESSGSQPEASSVNSVLGDCKSVRECTLQDAGSTSGRLDSSHLSALLVLLAVG